ncbi:MAG: nucleotidyl transferase AbiEii/AbiGii toxin family protein [candidate division KSB1 bacterium]|nr:nucleotidyl transferase AbiEii/AbiGii toxin family protein [candidate division KSB1 bacterium]
MIWQQLTEGARKQRVPLSTLVAEVFHLAVLEGLFARPESAKIAFQGGTCLHLVYGGYRYSEDLDFAGIEADAEFSRQLVSAARSAIEKMVVQMLGVGTAEWRLATVAKGKVASHWFFFQPQGQAQRYRLKIEFGRYPAYQAEEKVVRSTVDLLGRLPLVRALTPAELLAEKIAAVCGRPYLKGRDLFDVWYLTEVLGTRVDQDLLARKFSDYAVELTPQGFEDRTKAAARRSLMREMPRFLPERYRRQLGQDDYRLIQEKAMAVVWQSVRALGGE